MTRFFPNSGPGVPVFKSLLREPCICYVLTLQIQIYLNDDPTSGMSRNISDIQQVSTEFLPIHLSYQPLTTN